MFAITEGLQAVSLIGQHCFMQILSAIHFADSQASLWHLEGAIWDVYQGTSGRGLGRSRFTGMVNQAITSTSRPALLVGAQMMNSVCN